MFDIFDDVTNIDVATLVVGLSASCLAASSSSSVQKAVSCILCRRHNAYPRAWVCLTEGHLSLNIIEKIIHRPKFFTQIRTQDIFGFITLIPVIFFPKRSNFALAPFFSCA
jgi:hypothetical protein